MQVGDWVFVRHADEDLWALVTAIESDGDPAKVRLKLILELDGIPVGSREHRSLTSAVYLRLVSLSTRER